jgi:hypothetical protein
VKHRNGRVNISGDVWRIDKYDNYGNLVKRGWPMLDNSGRSPARQLNEPAGVLQSFLASRGYKHRVLRMVILSHPKGWIGTISGLTIDWLFRTDHLFFSKLVNRDGNLSDDEMMLARDLIQRDHEHHNNRRPKTEAVAQ